MEAKDSLLVIKMNNQHNKSNLHKIIVLNRKCPKDVLRKVPKQIYVPKMVRKRQLSPLHMWWMMDPLELKLKLQSKGDCSIRIMKISIS